MKAKNFASGLNIRQIAAGALLGAALAASFFALSGTAAGQAKQEMEERKYDEQGALIRPPRRAACKRVFDEKTAACINRELRKTDLNAPDSQHDVVGPIPHNRYKEVRQGTLVTYIREARKRPNFTIRGDALVERVLLKGHKATGVRYIDIAEKPVEVEAELVVASSGVYGTPAILQRSGIGPSASLNGMGLQVAVDLPVGENLLDHPGCAVIFHAPELSETTRRLFATNVRGPGGAKLEMEWQVHPFPIDQEEGTAGLWIYLPHQEARGVVLITSTDPSVLPMVDHAYNTGADDRFGHSLAGSGDTVVVGALREHRSATDVDGSQVGGVQVRRV